MEDNAFINLIDREFLHKRRFEKKYPIRGEYYRDQTAIIHSLPFRRMKKKTQVFFAPTNDHICTRVEHILHVHTIATTICKNLNLDVELGGAIALGHDLGHAPFGHTGESILNEIVSESGESFIHEINSFRVIEYLANIGKGLNLTYAVKNGIISHCGEKLQRTYEPDFTVRDLNLVKKRNIMPATYEGCVVRVSDIISYLGRDIEDAMRLNIISRDLIEKELVPNTKIDFQSFKHSINSIIIDKLIKDVIKYSKENNKIGMHSENYNIMVAIKNFNFKYIYYSKEINQYKFYVNKILKILFFELLNIFEKYKFDIEKYTHHFCSTYHDFGKYLDSYKEFYIKEKTNGIRIILDYISGMTDDYAQRACEHIIIPKRLF